MRLDSSKPTAKEFEMADTDASRLVMERRWPERTSCYWRCNAPLVWRLAEAGSEVCSQQLWRCTSCESVTLTGWRPPSWINATARRWEELQDGLADAIADAYTAGDSDA